MYFIKIRMNNYYVFKIEMEKFFVILINVISIYKYL